MLRPFILMLTPLGLLACAAAPQVGEKTAGEFTQHAETLTFTSTQPAARVARCFEREARLLPLSTLVYEADTRIFRYRLKAYDLWLEEAEFSDDPLGGSRVLFRHAGNYDTGWRTMLTRDRLDPLKACLRHKD